MNGGHWSSEAGTSLLLQLFILIVNVSLHLIPHQIVSSSRAEINFIHPWVYNASHSFRCRRQLCWLFSIPLPKLSSLCTPLTLCVPPNSERVGGIGSMNAIILALLASGFQFGWANRRHQVRNWRMPGKRWQWIHSCFPGWVAGNNHSSYNKDTSSKAAAIIAFLCC